MDPTDGMAYYSVADGTIMRYNFQVDRTEPVAEANLKRAYFSHLKPDLPGSMGYNWRQVIWSPTHACFFGTHGTSGYLFRFQPHSSGRVLELVTRMTSSPSRRAGQDDQFTYGYLGLTLGPDLSTLYLLTGGNTGAESTAVRKGAAKGEEDLHLVTFNLCTYKLVDHGPIHTTDGHTPSYVNSIAVKEDGSVYSLGRLKHGHTDLFWINGRDVSEL